MTTRYQNYPHIVITGLVLLTASYACTAMYKAQPWRPKRENRPRKFHQHRPAPFIHPDLIGSTNMPQPRPSPPARLPGDMPKNEPVWSDASSDSDAWIKVGASPSARDTVGDAGFLEPSAPAVQRPQTAPHNRQHADDYTPPKTPGTRILQNVIDLLRRDAQDPISPGVLGQRLSRDAHFAALYATTMTVRQQQHFRQLARQRKFASSHALARALLKDPETIRATLGRCLEYYRPASCAWAHAYSLPTAWAPHNVPDSLLRAHEYVTTKRLGQRIPTGSFCNTKAFLIRFLEAASRQVAYRTRTPCYR